MESVTRVCVLRSGGQYTPAHVQWLARQAPGLVCLADVDVPGVPTVPLAHNWPGWWAKLELFRPDIAGDLLYLDLDTVVLGDLAPLIDATGGRTTMLSDFYWPEHPASGLMYIAERDKARVWDAWRRDPHAHMRRRGWRGTLGDQGFLGRVLGKGVQRWQYIAPGRVVSYKAHCQQGLPAGADVVCFHGNPRPWAATADWIPPLC
ncbi:glycosyltransferase [Halomonas getboli]|uniref:glycosyltransferase n=1 Tax=Halomonas getboli TaxID=2935862 RepID=UPI001FFFD057|nr:glycosyltransferase [Halomonas getboli]MCK2183510.1 glycosyltransferase [Halomonas getboli]